MAKALKNNWEKSTGHKIKNPEASLKKKGKYDITVKLDMSFEDAIKKAVNTPIKNSKVKKK